MNAIATRAREVAAHFESKKDALRQTQDGLWKITFTTAEIPPWLLQASMGTRLMVAVALIGDDEQPIAPAEQRETAPRTPDPEKSAKAKLSYLDKNEMQRASVRSGILCRDPIFQAHLETPDADACAERLREMLGGSRSRIGTDEETYRIFLSIETDFRAATNQIAERRG